MAWGSAQYSALGAVVGAAATVIGAGLVIWQVHIASATLYGSNSYTVQKDVLEAADRIRDAQIQISSSPADRGKNTANLERQAIRFDALMDSVQGLKSNGGISDKTFAHILWWMCPSFSKPIKPGDIPYRLSETALDSTRDACTSNADLWKVRPQ